MNVIEKCEQRTKEDPEFIFWCCGCHCYHWFKTKGEKPRWIWNGSYDKPTVSPSILVQAEDDPAQRCHLFVRDGQLVFLADCSHKLRGSTVNMVDVDRPTCD